MTNETKVNVPPPVFPDPDLEGCKNIALSIPRLVVRYYGEQARNRIIQGFKETALRLTTVPLKRRSILSH